MSNITVSVGDQRINQGDEFVVAKVSAGKAVLQSTTTYFRQAFIAETKAAKNSRHSGPFKNMTALTKALRQKPCD